MFFDLLQQISKIRFERVSRANDDADNNNQLEQRQPLLECLIRKDVVDALAGDETMAIAIAALLSMRRSSATLTPRVR